ncbi:MAG TPA: DUF2961 domain-containing protein [Candidatus Hydrogenedentes bacterium]|nr:DUF2961 domain-containing protein [Candidatus Hydrogenedentota bacterium]
MEKSAALLILGITLSSLLYGTPITTGTLVDEMADMHHLTDFPAPFYKTVQFSSYDHTSSHPGGPGWFANSDGFGNEPIPNFEGIAKKPDSNGIGEYVICDVPGPGAIVRLWTARIEGNIRLYLDNNETPLYDGPAEEFFMRAYNRWLADTGLEEKPLVGTFYQRQAAYCPIPFARHCRIIWVGNARRIHFYQVQIRRYDPAAEVNTFSPADVKTYADKIQRASNILANPDAAWEYQSTLPLEKFSISVEPGQRLTALELQGPKAIERLTVSVHAPDRDLALRQTILHIENDDHLWGHVQSPVGDFFGAAPGVNPYASVPFSVAPNGTMTSRYIMPFAQKMHIVFENSGEQTVQIEGDALPMNYTWNKDASMYFCARWRIDHGMIGSGARPQDLPFLIANGAGVYVGSVSYVLNPNEVPSSGGNWWGEGDEKIFTDDDRTPSTFGTGSEDYYNYAWSSEDIFIFPYCAQPRNDGPANRGFVTNNRWHILDPLPFKQRISFYMELFPHETNKGMAYGRIGYYYARPGLMDDHVAITPEDVRKQELPKGWLPAARGAASNSVFFQFENQVQGSPSASLVEGNLWSAGNLYRWRPKNIGDEISFSVPIDESATYVLRLGTALDTQSGTISATVNNQPVTFRGDRTAVDLNDPYRVMLRCIELAPAKLPKGDSTLMLRFEGPEGKSIGLDFLWLQKK